MSTEIPLRGEQVRSDLFKVLPELEIRFRTEFEDSYDFATETPGDYLLFEDIVFPFIKETAGDDSKEQTLKTLFNFFERMAISTDPPVRDLFGIAITEQLAWHRELFGKVEQFVGPNTRMIIERDIKLFEERRATAK